MLRSAKRFGWLLTSFFLIALGPSAAEEPVYTVTANLPIALLLPPPECDDCEETKAELGELLHLQNTRTKEMEKYANDDHKRTLARFLTGITVQAEQLNRCAECDAFFSGLRETVEAAVDQAKEKYHRTRPYNLDMRLFKPKEKSEHDSFSYPSGHAAYGTAIGLILAEMLPEKRTEIFKRIENYGHSRLVAGVHFRSDVYAGEIAGSIVVASLLRDPDFLARFETVKTQLRNAFFPSKMPPYEHIFVLILENKAYGQIIGSKYAPRINGFAGEYGSATRFYGVVHPSEANYIALLGGSTFGIHDDDAFYCIRDSIDPNCPNSRSFD